MKVLLTGGAGFIGANAASWYVSRGVEVVIDRRPGDQRVYLGDIRLASEYFGWSQKNSRAQGLSSPHDLVTANQDHFR